MVRNSSHMGKYTVSVLCMTSRWARPRTYVSIKHIQHLLDCDVIYCMAVLPPDINWTMQNFYSGSLLYLFAQFCSWLTNKSLHTQKTSSMFTFKTKVLDLYKLETTEQADKIVLRRLVHNIAALWCPPSIKALGWQFLLYFLTFVRIVNVILFVILYFPERRKEPLSIITSM